VHYTNTHDKINETKLGLKQEALNTIYKGAILPLMLYGAPVWIRAMEKNYNRTLYSRVLLQDSQGLPYDLNDALCILTGNAPVELKAEEAAYLYRITKDKQNQQLDHETDPQDCTHPADSKNLRAE